MAKVPGFGAKREMLAGQLRDPLPDSGKPWFARPPRPTARRALVIGAGLAGCASAASLAARGWQVTLIERHGEVAQEGSGNPQGVLYLKLSAHGTALSQLVLAGFGHTRRLLERLQRGTDWDDCGVLQLAYDAKEAERQAQLAEAFPPGLLQPLSQADAEQLAGVPLPAGGLFYPEAGWAHPPALCRLLAEHAQIRLLSHRQALRLRRQDGDWQALDADDQVIAAAPVVVLANAADANAFAQTAELPLKRIRGQISCLPATTASRALRTVLCADGYVAPARGDEHTLGASFDLKNQYQGVTVEEHRSNLQLLAEISPDLAARLQADALDPAQLHGRAAYRCTSPDYLPLVGPLAEGDRFAETYAVLARDARQTPQAPCPWLDGLYLNLAHGSRGVVTVPLSGELLAAWLEDEPLPLPRAVAEACHPNRFALRQLIRGQA
jgi:tRNA 5-methylaminomethyl-2-thiouridine biosynthesis bifunctional protein